MSQYSYNSPLAEEWQDLVDWDGEIVEPMFALNADFNVARGDALCLEQHLSGSVDSDQPYLLSAPPSIADGTPSLEYTVSAPPSLLGESSSFGQVYSTSPYLNTTTTSPLVGYGDNRYFGSFDACDKSISPHSYPQESPILDTRYERIPDSSPPTGSFKSATETVFNPYVAGSSHSFSGLDVRASQMLNVGSWTETPHIIEPIAEADEFNTHAAPMSIPRLDTRNLYNTSSSYTYSDELEHNRSRAVTIPQSTRRPASYNAAITQSNWAQRVPPVLSVSPVSYRRPRSATMSRTNSRAGSRRGLATPSPTSDGLGWVCYSMDTQTNRLTPTSIEGTQGRIPRGRKRGLTAEQRTHAALMRVIGACSNCQKRKEKCDPGTPCMSCLEHYKGDLINHPCRDRLLSDLAGWFSSGLGWHPTARPLESFLAPGSFSILADITYNIPLYFGFGPALTLPVNAVHIDADQPHLHEHLIYSWPPESSTASQHTHAVLPAVLIRDAMPGLMQTLDSHLSLLVTHHFRHFPLFCSPLRILRDVYVFFRSLPTGSSQYRLLQQALKLLVLVHIGGDMMLPPPSSNAVLAQLVEKTMPSILDDNPPTPCFIRSQLGSVMPGLALCLMKEVLSSLEHLLLHRDCDAWPLCLAVTITVLMTIESTHYHAAKLPYHHSFDAPRTSTPRGAVVDDEGVRALLAFYSSCFSGCHARLAPEWEGEAVANGRGAQGDVFVQSLRACLGSADTRAYLKGKAVEEQTKGDMVWFFDRLVARLLVVRA
ncbi:hypothetical protein BDU57DRAFT_520226 [Ampelomyces quisqualis]|uniref:Zn(2)-C6 fungal-type domain-containing protein n=1 Tax=Ampelomyces quisqualis TaxID=50730 RepID=A0A6A5QHH1_AMPQU|nr:hypothetical protein BDU57DRAFT_520226 [Ampelomyces quisqualis]